MGVGGNEVLPPPPPADNVCLDFKNRCANLRDLIIKLAKPRIEGVGMFRLNQGFGEVTFGCGRKVTSTDDLNEAYATEKYTKEMRAMIFFMTISAWGTNNNWAIMLENKIMCMLKLAYDGTYCEKQAVQRKHLGGSIKAIIVRLKQSNLVNKFRRTGRRVHREVILKKRPKKLSAGVKRLVNATVETHGFNGILGLYEGHPVLVAEAKKAAAESKNVASAVYALPPIRVPGTPATSLVSSPPSECPSDLAEWFFAKAKAGMTKKDLLRQLEEAPEEIITGITDTDQSSLETSVRVLLLVSCAMKVVSYHNFSLVMHLMMRLFFRCLFRRRENLPICHLLPPLRNPSRLLFLLEGRQPT
jgi:hypothetical protein